MKLGTPHLVIVNYTSQTNRTPISSYDSSVANFRSCRNPEGRMAKPWCYVSAITRASIFVPTVGYRKAPCKVDMCGKSKPILFVNILLIKLDQHYFIPIINLLFEDLFNCKQWMIEQN